MFPNMLNLFIAQCFLCYWSAGAIGSPLLRIEQGVLRGSYMNTTEGRQIYAFRKIPYAEPPLGNLRFKAPEPGSKWNGTYDASQDGPMCSQVRSRVYYGDENCLTLNVYTHSVNRCKRSPVLVDLHGGGLISGSVQATDIPPEMLMNEDIVLVLPQYRLSALGFFSTGDEASPGNYGLLDQALALQWVEKNIHNFGGDPRKVTLGGQSAGGVSVGYQLISPMSEGLFRAALIQSGPVLANLAFLAEPLPLARQLGKLLNCNSEDNYVLVNCLRDKSARQIIESAVLVPGISLPVVEKREYGKFLFDTPTKLYSEGRFTKVPTIIGTVKDEVAAIINATVLPTIESLPNITINDLNQIFDVYVQLIIQLLGGYNTNLRNLTNAAREEYAKIYNYYDKKQLTKAIMDIGGDAIFRAPAAKQAALMAGYNPKTYLYSFEYEGDGSTLSYFGEKAVTHGEDGYYLFSPNQSESDSKFSEQFRSMLINFMYFLDPTPNAIATKWTPTPAAANLSYLEISNESNVMKEGYFTEQLEFWNDIVPTIVGSNYSVNYSSYEIAQVL